MAKKVKSRKFNKKQIKLKKQANQFTAKVASKYQRIDKNMKLTRRSVLLSKKGIFNQAHIAETTKLLNDNGYYLLTADVKDIVYKFYYDKKKTTSVKTYSVLNYFEKISSGNLVKFFLQNMNIDIADLAAKLNVSVDWLLNENNWDWKLNKNGERVTPTRVHTTPKGKNVNFDWDYSGGTIINVK